MEVSYFHLVISKNGLREQSILFETSEKNNTEMKLLSSLFVSNEKQAKLDLIRVMLTLADADGHIDDSEMTLIAAVATREGLTEKEFRTAVKDGSTRMAIPKDSKTKLTYLNDLVSLMMVDGDISDSEIMMVKGFAIKLGFKPELVDLLILNTIKDIVEYKNKKS